MTCILIFPNGIGQAKSHSHFYDHRVGKTHSPSNPTRENKDIKWEEKEELPEELS